MNIEFKEIFDIKFKLKLEIISYWFSHSFLYTNIIQNLSFSYCFVFNCVS